MALVPALARELPVQAVARLVGENDTGIWRILQHYVERARGAEDFSGVSRVGIDETASKRGHNYISHFVDLERSKVLFPSKSRTNPLPGRAQGISTCLTPCFGHWIRGSAFPAEAMRGSGTFARHPGGCSTESENNQDPLRPKPNPSPMAYPHEIARSLILQLLRRY